MNRLDELLEAIAALAAEEQQALFARLRETYDRSAPAPAQLAFAAAGFDGLPDFIVVFDGGALGNPGAGHGHYAIFEGGAGQTTRLSFEGEMTNNEAEYRSLLAALGALLARLESAGRAPADLTLEVRGDSALVLNQVRGAWKAREPRLRDLRDQAWELLRRFKAARLVSQPRADTVRVLGH